MRRVARLLSPKWKSLSVCAETIDLDEQQRSLRARRSLPVFDQSISLLLDADRRDAGSISDFGFSENGARGTRTPDLLGAIQALSQLSYSPGRVARPQPRAGHILAGVDRRGPPVHGYLPPSSPRLPCTAAVRSRAEL